MLLVALIIVGAALVVLYSSDAGLDIPPDEVEVIVVRRENEPSFNVGPSTEEGSQLLSKCEDVLSNLSGHAPGFRFENEVAEMREKYAYVEIIFKDNYDVPIYARWSAVRDRVPSSRIFFVLSGEPEGYWSLGEVLLRGVGPSPWDNSFIWNLYRVSPSDQIGWPIFQELINTVNEIQGP